MRRATATGAVRLEGSERDTSSNTQVEPSHRDKPRHRLVIVLSRERDLLGLRVVQSPSAAGAQEDDGQAGGVRRRGRCRRDRRRRGRCRRGRRRDRP